MHAWQRYRVLCFLKVAAFIFSCWYIWYHVTSRLTPATDPTRLFNTLADKRSAIGLLGVLVLMILNWSIEALKWKWLLKPVETISFSRALRSVFGGVTFSFYTPNRIGEFAGRIVHLKPEHRVNGTLATFVGNTSQALITVQAGILAGVFCDFFILPSGWRGVLQATSVILTVSLLILWFRIPHLLGYIGEHYLPERIRKYALVFSHYKFPELLQVYTSSASRYFVFCFQQYILFNMFGMHANFIDVFALSAVSFLVISVIPSIALGELGLRGGVNLAVFGHLFTDSTGILAVTFLLWAINLAIPALMGAFAILYIRISNNGNK